MIAIRKINCCLILSLLFIPVLAYAGNFFNLPRVFTFYFQLLFWGYGIFFVLYKQINPALGDGVNAALNIYDFFKERKL